MNSKRSKEYISLRVNDVFDELFCENKRLLNELLFANKCLNVLNKFKSHLNKIYDKFESIIGSEDKEVLNELSIEYNNCINDKHLNEEIVRKSDENINKLNDLNKSETKPKPKPKTKTKTKTKKCINKVNKSAKQHKNSKQNRIKRDEYFDSTTNSYKCPETDCLKTFQTNRNLIDHLRRVHIKAEILCEFAFCTKVFKTRSDMTKHMKIHNDLKPFQCNQENCEFKCRTKTNLEMHLKRHLNERPFRCDDCGKTYKLMSDLRVHQKNHKNEPTIRCRFDGCDRLFFNANQIYRHKIFAHNMKPYVTKYRKNRYRSSFGCDWPGCEFSTDSRSKLAIHKHIHTGEKSFCCDWPECGKTFRIKANLKDHKNIHNNLKPYQCSWPGCGYRCSSGPNMTKHMRTVHRNKAQLN